MGLMSFIKSAGEKLFHSGEAQAAQVAVQAAPTPENVAKTKKVAPPRCPPRYDCRSAGTGVPIDMCVRQ